MVGILFSLYFIPMKLGYPKVGKYLVIILSVFLVLVVLFWVFQDSFFTKNQARGILAKQGIVLKDDFKVLNNKSRSPMADYYHRFRLEISDNDKNAIIEEIKNTEGFIGLKGKKIDVRSNLRGFNVLKTIQNFEVEDMFVKEYFRPNHEGEPSIYKKIEIEKTLNTIVYIEMQD